MLFHILPVNYIFSTISVVLSRLLQCCTKVYYLFIDRAMHYVLIHGLQSVQSAHSSAVWIRIKIIKRKLIHNSGEDPRSSANFTTSSVRRTVSGTSPTSRLGVPASGQRGEGDQGESEVDGPGSLNSAASSSMPSVSITATGNHNKPVFACFLFLLSVEEYSVATGSFLNPLKWHFTTFIN